MGIHKDGRILAASEPEHPDFCLSGYDFALPEEHIAQRPASGRCDSRLMILRRSSGLTEETSFAELVRHLPEGCLLVANNSRVAPARLRGTRSSGGKVEFLLLTPPPLIRPEPVGPEFVDILARSGAVQQTAEDARGPRQGAEAAAHRGEANARQGAEAAAHRGEAKARQGAEAAADAKKASLRQGAVQQAAEDARGPRQGEEPAAHGGEANAWQGAEVEGLLRPVKKIPLGEWLRLAPDVALQVLKRGSFGRCRARILWRGALPEALKRSGSLPLPPYIRRNGPDSDQVSAMDAERYQTVYARQDKAGSVAAPTAGLHMTPELLAAFERSGRHWAEVTLYVGYGTFSPVRSADIREHSMHAEYAELPAGALTAIRKAKAEGRPVIALGTTSARVLEGVWQMRPDLFLPGLAPEIRAPGDLAFAGMVSAFLYPGRPIGVIDGLITNFHLPRSSLLMLVSALAGRRNVLDAYRRAVERGFRFFSYGDAMLIL